MATQTQIQKTRQTIAEQKTELQKQIAPTETQMALRHTGMEGLRQRKLARVPLERLQQQEASFETEVAKYRPSEAKPEYKEKVLAEAKTKVQAEMAKWESKMKAKEARGDLDDRYEEYKDQYQYWKSYLEKLEKGVGISAYYSGQAEAKIEAKLARKEAKEKYKEQLKKAGVPMTGMAIKWGDRYYTEEEFKKIAPWYKGEITLPKETVIYKEGKPYKLEFKDVPGYRPGEYTIYGKIETKPEAPPGKYYLEEITGKKIVTTTKTPEYAEVKIEKAVGKPFPETKWGISYKLPEVEIPSIVPEIKYPEPTIKWTPKGLVINWGRTIEFGTMIPTIALAGLGAGLPILMKAPIIGKEITYQTALLKRVIKEPNIKQYNKAVENYMAHVEEAKTKGKIVEENGKLIVKDPITAKKLEKEWEQIKEIAEVPKEYEELVGKELKTQKETLAYKWKYKIEEPVSTLRLEYAPGKTIGIGTRYIMPRFETFEKDYEKRLRQQPDVFFSRLLGKEKEYVQFKLGFAKGAYEGIRTKPVQTAALTVAAFVAPWIIGKAIGVSGLVAGKVSGYALATKTTKTLATGAKVAGLGLLGLYGVTKTAQIATAPTIKTKGEIVGETITTELAPILIGGYLGAKFMPKIEGYFRTLGRKEIDIEKLVPKEVLKGTKRFPEAGQRLPRLERAKLHYKLFTKKESLIPGIKKEAWYFHAAEKQAWKPGKEFIVKGKLFGAYRVSPHFLKITKTGYKLYGGEMIYPYGKPGVVAIKPKGYKLSLEPYKGFWHEIYKKAPLLKPKGIAYIPGVKYEVEALLAAETKLIPVKLPTKYFITWKGVRVPVDVFATQPVGDIKLELWKALQQPTGLTISKAEIAKLVKSAPSSPYAPSYSYLTTPASYLSLASIIPQYSKPISKISYPSKIYPISPHYPTYYSVSKVSLVSYKAPPSKPVSYAPPSKPPVSPPIITPPYTPPYIVVPPTPPILPILLPISKAEKKREYLVKGWITEIIKRGKWEKITPKPVLKHEAIRIGEKRALTTLVATFRIKPTKKMIRGVERAYRPREELFRTYKIVKGRRVPLELTWIQKKEKRLGRRAEVLQVQAKRREFLATHKSKRRRKKRTKWL